VPAFGVLVALLIADNLLWRVGGWISAHAFVAVTGDLHEDMFEYLAGHAPSYFSDKQRLLHALAAAVLSAALLGGTVWLSSVERATGDVVLICSLGFSILHGSRDVAVAFVNPTQYVARLA
jgi:hypothetical protein